ncbi:hypothetical protein ACSNOH_12750 [Streptomyces sp. URMC 127]|uniref:hypothetical protein n=1 Tax=Streptomyces sp. URMC 127 TaxID=3423402 RepID=UPI003F1AE7D4
MKHSLYGVREADVHQTARIIAEVLNCDFQERESDYLGVYWLARAAEARIKVVSLLAPDGEPLEEGFEQYETLIYVDAESFIPQFDGLTAPQGPLERLRDPV